MKKQWFHVRLYGEVLRQLKTPGILLTILCSFLAISGPSNVGRYQPKTLWFDNIFPLGRVYLAFLAPLFVLLAFRYVMKRRDSDFYDSLPIARTAVFFSRFAAAMTWTIVILAVQMTVGICLCQSFLPAFPIAYGDLVRTILGILAANLRIGAVAALAITFCGTSLTAVTATALIQFFPIIYFNVLEECLGNAYRRIQYMIHLPDGTHENNPVWLGLGEVLETWREIMRIDYFFDASEVIWPQTLFSVVVAALVLSLAGFLFVRRRSDLAGQATAKPFLHVCMRFGVALLPLWWFYAMGGPDVFSIIMPLIFYISYEMIVVRKWKRLLSSLAWIPLLAALYLLPYGVQELIVWYGNSR
ncbi:MAG: hypothetical protein E7618_03940 [Ruminococcaceae bacterium]|nr:hypothetical protein [Oscillospiraceae bacterium]